MKTSPFFFFSFWAPSWRPGRRTSIMHCYQRGVIWLLTKYRWQWEWTQLGVWRVVIKKMLSCATLHLEQIWINIALRGYTHQKGGKVHSFLEEKLEWHLKWNLMCVNCSAAPLIRDSQSLRCCHGEGTLSLLDEFENCKLVWSGSFISKRLHHPPRPRQRVVTVKVKAAAPPPAWI